MSTLKKVFKDFKLDFTSILLIPDGGGYFNTSEFKISPNDFLGYAKKDFYQGNQHGLINGLTNAKRAIDCQIDSVLTTFDIDISRKGTQVKDFLTLFTFNAELPIKLKVIQALDLAPSFLISKVRNLRNKLEHFYEIPTPDEVHDAIEIADLFIRSIKYKMISIDDKFHIIDKNKFDEEIFKTKYGTVNRSIMVCYFEKEKQFSIYYNPIKDRTFDESCLLKHAEDIVIEILSDVPEYFGLLKLMLSMGDITECQESFKLLLKLIEHEMPLEKIKVEF